MESGFGLGGGEDDDQALSWRQEADESLSDYTIVVGAAAATMASPPLLPLRLIRRLDSM
jgi:hypothetical protein